MAVTSVVDRSRLRLAIGGGLLVMLLVTLHLISSAVQNSAVLSRLFVPLLLVSIAGLLALLVVIAVSLVRLGRAYRREEAGARLTVRMVLLFSVLSLLPVAVVYSYSMQFLMRGIDSWFDVEIDEAMQDALQLGRASLDLHQHHLQDITERLVRRLTEAPPSTQALRLNELRRQAGATELAVLDTAGRTLASSNVNPAALVADTPDRSVLQQVREGQDYVGLAPYGEDDLLHVRVVIADRSDPDRVLQALYPLSQRVTELSEEVQGAFTRYRELSFLRQSLKFSFSLTLLLVLLFSIFGAVWAAIFSARRLLAPVTDLAAATSAIAEGDYSTQLVPPRRSDELGFLVRSFNAMTRRIAQASDAAAESQRQVEAQRAYLETVLSHLSTAVFTFDGNGMIRTANEAVQQILRIDPASRIGSSLVEVGRDRPELEPLTATIERECAVEPPHEWEQQVSVVLDENRRILRCGGTPLPSAEDASGPGWLIMIEDITMLLQAQRDAAWGEVARRLAHEIKNPLTPIQLSAERIRRRYLGKLDDEQGQVLDRATHTIVQQVEALKSMVNAFSDYARPSRPEAAPVTIDRLVGEVLELYRAGGGVTLDIQLNADGVQVRADGVKLRQVMHNLVKNAQEALADREEGRIRVSTHRVGNGAACAVEIVVEDNGPGFDQDMIGQVFEPYVTTKSRGTGLGLAIVRKIMDEHGGTIGVGRSELGGAKVTLRLRECDPEQPLPDAGQKEVDS
jgi:nitrogen fixation/metabolism regulation signal transduction histidine kinase